MSVSCLKNQGTKKQCPSTRRDFSMVLVGCALRCISFMLLLSAVRGGTCPELYKRYSKMHTFCLPPNRQCRVLDSKVSGTYSEEIVRTHNEYRNRIAMGKETIGNLPSASDMLQMEWDNELAAIAQKHTEQCKFEHDCGECRQTQNFGVGQNLAKASSSGGGGLPKPDWRGIVKLWYDEVKDFNKGVVGSFNPNGLPGVVGHFTQVIWAQSWRIGCGYTVYEQDGEINQLYTCNYGPLGNFIGQPVYTSGKPCSRCPINSCCGRNCNGQSAYDGLCKITDGKAPQYPREGSYVYYCDFEDPLQCNYETPPGMKQWTVYHTLSGSYIGVVLQPGETSTLNFTRTLPAENPSCVALSYRKGPNVDGQNANNEMKARFEFSPQGYVFDIPISSNGAQFMGFRFSLNLNSDFKTITAYYIKNGRQMAPFYEAGIYGEQRYFHRKCGHERLKCAAQIGRNIKRYNCSFSIAFIVPPGASAQYLEVNEIFLKKGKC